MGLIFDIIGFLISAVFSLLQVINLIGIGYYYFLLVCGIPKPKVKFLGSLSTSFAVAIPAHDEEAVLARTLVSLAAQDYPTSLFDVYVVADHCNDATAQIARANGAFCYERQEGPAGRKAYALRWLLDRILASDRHYDALVVFDADSYVDPAFLRTMDAALHNGHQVLQGQHLISNPRGSLFGRIADVDMRLNNLLRNRAKRNLGLSARLMGDAMCFRREIIQQYGWPVDSLVEDRGYGLYLLTKGIKTIYVPEAISRGQAAPGWRSASIQRIRWYSGVLQIQKQFVPRLLKAALHGNLAALDQAVEMMLPPVSVLALSSVVIIFAHLILQSLLLPISISLVLVTMWVLFPFLGLYIAEAPASAFSVVLFGPLYLAWRVGLGVKAALLGKHVQWVRTSRHEEIAVRGGNLDKEARRGGGL